MAKDLPYFKFYCSEWTDGDITLESFEVQGLFINICSYYWSNECYLHIDKLKKRFKHDVKSVDYLLKIGIIHNEDGYLSIHFLDEQQMARLHTSKQNSKAGKISAEKRKQAKLNEEATSVEIALNEEATIKKREEKRREEKRKKLNILETFETWWKQYPNKKNKAKAKESWLKLKDVDRAKCINVIVEFSKYKEFEGYNHPHPTTYLNQKRWDDDLTTQGKNDGIPKHLQTRSFPV